MPRDPDDQQKRNLATAAAMTGLVLASLALLGLMSLVIPDIIWVVAVLAGLMVIGAIQYALWGWRLDRYRIKDDDES